MTTQTNAHKQEVTIIKTEYDTYLIKVIGGHLFSFLDLSFTREEAIKMLKEILQ